MSTLYIVGTPIGNLGDITYRAVEILKEVDFIICEDTRISRRLLAHYQIDRPLVSYHQHSRLVKIDQIVDRLKQGESAALITDAGTPGISDPGNYFISQIRGNLPEVEVIVIPGPSALTASASICGINMDRFTFLGFLPHKKGRLTMLKQMANSEIPVMIYESPYRLMKTVAALKELISPDQKLIVAKELTKINELCITGNAETVEKYFIDNPDKVKGEFVIIIGQK
ncbi:MAG: 16S rRNA (cytidine(1402)-2'-O)-methyltransferase [Patescibacteria group bacterium]